LFSSSSSSSFRSATVRNIRTYTTVRTTFPLRQRTPTTTTTPTRAGERDAFRFINHFVDTSRVRPVRPALENVFSYSCRSSVTPSRARKIVRRRYCDGAASDRTETTAERLLFYSNTATRLRADIRRRRRLVRGRKSDAIRHN